jgi:small neutral amino acid transporter SnatA (MarC family)
MKRTDTNTGVEWVVNMLFQVGIVILLFIFAGVMVNTITGLRVTVLDVCGGALLTWFSVRACLLYR